MSILEKPIVRIVIGLILVGFIVLLLYLGTREEEPEVVPPEPPLSEREKMLQSLTAPADAPPLLEDEEKEQLLDSMSAPSDSQSGLSDEERKKVLESLSAP